MSKNKGRISSDNYNIFLSMVSHPNKPTINITDKYGISSFKWELIEEEIIIQPVTRIDPEIIIIPKGVRLEFSTKKENLDDLMMLFVTQNSLALGRNATKKNFGLKTTKRTQLGTNLRTDPLNNKPTDINVKGKANTHVAKGVSIFNNTNSVHYVYPTYELTCTIKHFAMEGIKNGQINHIEEGFIFKNVKLFSPTQSVQENSSDIEESFKGFASWIEIKDTNKKENRWTQYVTEMIDYQFTNNKPESLPYLNRRIVNPTNKKFIE